LQDAHKHDFQFCINFWIIKHYYEISKESNIHLIYPHAQMNELVSLFEQMIKYKDIEYEDDPDNGGVCGQYGTKDGKTWYLLSTFNV